MTEERIRDAALAYMKHALGKECHCLDAVMVDDEWVARVVAVESKERRGATSGPKRWQVLYQVHLGLDGEPLYYVKKGLWEKDLPEVPAPQPAPAIKAQPQAPATPPAAVAPVLLAETPEAIPEPEPGAEPPTPVFAEQPATVDLSEIPITVGTGEDSATPEAGEETEPETPPAEPEPVEPPTAAPALAGQPLGERQGPPRLTFHYEASEGEETG
jgi:hypothetical protein